MPDPNNILDAIFADGHKPAHTVGRGMYEPGRAISFPTNKVPSGVIRARSTLMADGLLHLDTDPNIVQLSPYPMEVAYWSTQDGKMPVKRDHIPDMAIMLRDDRILFVDYIPLQDQANIPFFWRRVAERKRHFQDELGCDYAVHDERSIQIEPRLSNLRLMWTPQGTPYRTDVARPCTRDHSQFQASDHHPRDLRPGRVRTSGRVLVGR